MDLINFHDHTNCLEQCSSHCQVFRIGMGAAGNGRHAGQNERRGIGHNPNHGYRLGKPLFKRSNRYASSNGNKQGQVFKASMCFGKHISHLLGFHCQDDHIGASSQFSVVSKDRYLICVPEVVEPILADVTDPDMAGIKAA